MSHQSVTPDIVTVFIYSSRSARAECSCGWEGRRRIIRGFALVDAWIHAANVGCLTGDALVIWSDRPLPPQRRRAGLLALGSLAAAMAILGGALFFSVPANADAADDYAAEAHPFICETIAEKPYISTVVSVIETIAVDTGDYEFAGSVLGVAVRDWCPWNRGTVERWIAMFSPAHEITVPRGAMGGAI